VGRPYPPDTDWQREFEAEFPYEPTEDQVTSAEEIKQDMQNAGRWIACSAATSVTAKPSWRCGGVQGVEFGKQVAILVPTTVLAEQHYRSFRERMADYPFSIESISRFKIARSRRTSSSAPRGEVDILIGTHRLISNDVKFADLGWSSSTKSSASA
jgi:transcription-repair coupling factor (superfamily II helicase)